MLFAHLGAFSPWLKAPTSARNCLSENKRMHTPALCTVRQDCPCLSVVYISRCTLCVVRCVERERSMPRRAAPLAAM
eukprot:3831633-Alexandrium_andersonii.AAC.1